LCDDIRLKRAAIESIRKFGVGAGGSRLTCGNFELHRELEERLAKFKDVESCIVLEAICRKYRSNIGNCGQKLVIFCDRLNHASIVDGIRLSGAKLVVYKHCDMEDLESKIVRYHTGKSLIVTDACSAWTGMWHRWIGL